MSKYVVIDLEMCNVPKGFRRNAFGYSKELIQIGAVLLDEKFDITDTFVTLVKPEYGLVDSYIENLTGISREDTNNAPSTIEAINSFLEWLPEDAILVSWSDNDEHQLRKEIKGKNINIDRLNSLFDNWIDCQATFGEKMGVNKCYKLSEALIIADICPDDGEHDALVDARNTAYLFAKMQRENDLVLNQYIVSEEDAQAGFNPFAELFANLKIAV